MKSCIITPEAVGPFGNGGVGTHCTNLAMFLARRHGAGSVTLLYTGRIERGDCEYWRREYAGKYGVDFAWIDQDELKDRKFARHAGLKNIDDVISQEVLEYLSAHRFDVCFFQEMMGAGFRPIQAKRTGQALRDTVLTCMVHSSTRWIHEAMKMQPVNGMRQTLKMYMERYSVEHCDMLLSPSQYMLDWSGEDVGRLPRETRVVTYLTNKKHEPVGMRPANRKLIFFGRLEQRKGFALFLESLLLLLREDAVAKPLEVHLLGKNGFTSDGDAQATIAKFRERSGDRIVLIVQNDLGHEEVIAYLKEHNDGVVVCPSIVDNSPNAIIEAFQLGVNIVSCATGGIPELFEGRERLCAPEAPALARLLAGALNNELPPVAPRYTPEQAVREWTDLLAELERSKASSSFAKKIDRLAVVMAAAERNPDHAKQREALAAQTFPRFDIIEVESERAASLPADLPLVILPVGCIPSPEALQRFVAAFESCDCEALLAWSSLNRPGGGRVKYMPFGPAHEVAIYGNTLGLGLLGARAHTEMKSEMLASYLFSPRFAWSKLVQMLAVGGHSCDVLPVDLSVNDIAPSRLVASQRTYDEQRMVIDLVAAGMPRWQKRLVEMAAGTELRAAAYRAQIQARAESVSADAAQ